MLLYGLRGKAGVFRPSLIATITTYDSGGKVAHSDMREYPDASMLWEHIGCQQNNRKTVWVVVETDGGLEYKVQFSRWTPRRCFTPSPRFHSLLRNWGVVFLRPKNRMKGLQTAQPTKAG